MPKHNFNNAPDSNPYVLVGFEPIIGCGSGAVAATTTAYCAPGASAGALIGAFLGGACVPAVIALLCIYNTQQTPGLPHLQELPITGSIYNLFCSTSDISAPTTTLSPYDSGINNADGLQAELMDKNPDQQLSRPELDEQPSLLLNSLSK